MMKAVNGLSFALGILIVGHVEAKPLDPHKPVHARPPILRSDLNALGPDTILRWPVPFTGATSGLHSSSPETDGLSRNPDDCKYGCIDNGG